MANNLNIELEGKWVVLVRGFFKEGLYVRNILEQNNKNGVNDYLIKQIERNL